MQAGRVSTLSRNRAHRCQPGGHGPQVVCPADRVRCWHSHGTAGRSLRLAAALGVLLALAASCKVSKEQVKDWAASKDVGRLARVVHDAKQSMEVRQEAAYQLVQLERFFPLEKALKESSRPDARKIAGDLIKRLSPVMSRPRSESAAIVQAKDGLFSAWYFASPADRRQVEILLVRWVIFGPLGSGGDHSVGKILKALDRRGANLMAELVPPDHPNLFRYDAKTVVSKSCLLGHFWKKAGVAVRQEAARRFMKAVQKDQRLALQNGGAALISIGLLGGNQGTDYLARLLASDPSFKVRAMAAVSLRIVAQVDRKALGVQVRDAAAKNLLIAIKTLNADKDMQNPTVRGVSYLEHLLELVVLFKGEKTFAELTPIIAAPYVSLTDPDRALRRALLRLLAVGFLMRLDPVRALRLGYDRLPKEEEYPRGAIRGGVFVEARTLWTKHPDKRPALLRGLRAGLAHPSWVAKAIAMEVLKDKAFLPRSGVKKDVAALRALFADETPLKGDDWRGATVGQWAKKAVEFLSGKK